VPKIDSGNGGGVGADGGASPLAASPQPASAAPAAAARAGAAGASVAAQRPRRAAAAT
jgi:hypothetical protein